jgi:molybdenum cofactor guanylyltransferase
MPSEGPSGDRREASLGAVLAGGRASRMGEPKAAVELAGRPLISYPLETVAAAGLEPVVVAKPDSELPELDCRVIRERAGRSHPAAGILSALENAAGPIVVVACDMPFVPAQLVTVLSQLAARAAIPWMGDGLQPLLARYGPSVARELERAVERREPLRDAVRAVDPLVLGPDELAGFGDLELIAFNVNDRRDLEAAERLMTTAPSR